MQHLLFLSKCEANLFLQKMVMCENCFGCVINDCMIETKKKGVGKKYGKRSNKAGKRRLSKYNV